MAEKNMNPFRRKKIYVAGHNGMAGSAILRNLAEGGYRNIIIKDSRNLDLRNQCETEKFIKDEKPEVIIIAAAKVGGIQANNIYRGEFLYDNIMIAANIINSAYKYGVEKLIFLGSSCIYPKNAAQPIKEEELLNGRLEYTNEPYAISKIAGIKMCENYYRQYGCNFISIMPCNLYGPNDNYDLNNSHVLPALIRKFHNAAKAKDNSVVIWGTGMPEREFLYVDDLASAVRFMLENIDAKDISDSGISHINAGYGKDITIRHLAELITAITDYKGDLIFDSSKPDGTQKKLMDSTRINKLGWRAKTNLEEGISKTYKWFKEHYSADN